MMVRIPPVVIPAALVLVCAAWFYLVAGRGRARITRLACAVVGGALFWVIEWQVPEWFPAAALEVSRVLARHAPAAGEAGFRVAAVVVTIAAGALAGLVIGVRRPRALPAPPSQPAEARERMPLGLQTVEELPLLSEARTHSCPYCGQVLPGRTAGGRAGRRDHPGQSSDGMPPDSGAAADVGPADAEVAGVRA